MRYSQKLAQPQVNYVSSVMTSEASITISERKNWKFIYLKKSLTRTVKAAPLDTLANASANAYKVKRLLQGSASD